MNEWIGTSGEGKAVRDPPLVTSSPFAAHRNHPTSNTCTRIQDINTVANRIISWLFASMMDNDPTMAIAALIALLLVVVGGAAAAYFLVFAPGKSDLTKTTAAPVHQAEQPGAGGRARRAAGGRMQAGMRRRRAAAAQQQQAAQTAAAEAAETDEDPDNSEGEAEEEAGEVGGRDRRRQARQAELAAAREAREAGRAVRASRQAAYSDRLATKQAAREAEEAAREEEEKRLAAARQAEEDAEAEKWRGMISVEQEGAETNAGPEEHQGLLAEFMEYIRERKTVMLEELAAHFGLRVHDVINRVQGLESMGRLTGVMDDRGKFIYISREEMEAVAAFIKRRGRVAISELAAHSNNLVDLEARDVAPAATAAASLDLDFDTMLADEAGAVVQPVGA